MTEAEEFEEAMIRAAHKWAEAKAIELCLRCWFRGFSGKLMARDYYDPAGQSRADFGTSALADRWDGGSISIPIATIEDMVKADA